MPRVMSDPTLDLLQSICSVPTAPFNERPVLDFIDVWAKKRRRLKVARDKVGNTLLELPGRDAQLPRLVLVAHVDHPGFTALEMTGPKTLRARFNGYVTADYFPGAAVRFFDGDEIRGKIESVETGDDKRPTAAVIKVPRPVTTGAIGMWDQGEGRVKAGKFYSRVCDDLAGVACALSVLDNALSAKPKAGVAVLCTRAEEEGFIGAIYAAKERKLLRKTDRIISIECSMEQPYAKQGGGVILRAGDRTSVFHSAFSRFLAARAQELAKTDKSFKAQRALMPGGTCEATVFDAYGYVAAAVCVPLGNYHNMNVATGKIGPEYIDLGDYRSEVALLTDAAKNHHTFTGDHADLRAQLEKRFDRWKPLL